MPEKNRFPIKTLIGGLVYGVAAEYFDFGSREWFPSLRPDVWIAHPLYGYFLASLGKWGYGKLDVFKGKKDLASRIVGGTGIILKEVADIIRYADINAFSAIDMLGGAFGVLLENYQTLKKKSAQKDF